MLSNLCFLTHDSPTPCQQLCKVDRPEIIALILLPRKRRHRDLVLRECQLKKGDSQETEIPSCPGYRHVRPTPCRSAFFTGLQSRTSLEAGGRWVCLGQQRLAWTEVFRFNKSRVWERSPGGSPWILAGGRKATRGEKDRRDVGGEGE